MTARLVRLALGVCDRSTVDALLHGLGYAMKEPRKAAVDKRGQCWVGHSSVDADK